MEYDNGGILPGPTMHTIWCSGCSGEPAIEMLEIEWNGEWVSFPVGTDCLTRARENDRIEE